MTHGPARRLSSFARLSALVAVAALATLAACSSEPSTAPRATRAVDQPLFSYTSTTPVYRNHLEFGTPFDASSTNDLQLRKTEYATSHNCAEGIPNWVSWNLNKTHYGPATRSTSFYADTTLPAGCPRITTSDYTNSGYSRGHMTRSEERTTSTTANKATFLLTNIVPQQQDMNAGPWYKFELWLEDQANLYNKEIYVISGPRGNLGTLNGAGKVVIPSHTWKIAVLMPYGQGLANVTSTASLQVVAVMMPNQAGIATAPWQNYITTVDNIEYYTKYNYLDKLADTIEAAVESKAYVP